MDFTNFISPGEAIKYMLDKKNWTQEDFAQIISISPKHANELIKNKKPLSLELIIDISDAFSFDEEARQGFIKLYTNYRVKTIDASNDNLVKSISDIQDKRTTDNQIVNYKNEQTSWFNNMNKILLVLYYFLALIFMYQMIKKNISSTNKYITFFLLLVFPFVIGKIELLLYNTMKYIWTFIMCVEYPYQRSLQSRQ